jgi:hypothetical protein
MKKSASFSALALFLGLASSPLLAEDEAFDSDQPKTVLTEKSDFDRSELMSNTYRGSSVSGLSFVHPNRFSMQQSYSMSFSSGSLGSQSSGLYLNTLAYKLAEPLTLSADLGFYTPFYSSLPGMQSSGMRGAAEGSSMVFPRVGLEYKPSKNLSMSLQLFNGPDAAKAYGYDGFLSPWYR